MINDMLRQNEIIRKASLHLPILHLSIPLMHAFSWRTESEGHLQYSSKDFKLIISVCTSPDFHSNPVYGNQTVSPDVCDELFPQNNRLCNHLTTPQIYLGTFQRSPPPILVYRSSLILKYQKQILLSSICMN